MSGSSKFVPSSAAASQFSCKICDITFENSPLQRTHAKSDWHIYNLKRRMTTLPPISLKIYNERVANIQDISETEGSESSTFHQSCIVCAKDFYSPKAYQSHLKSSLHAQATANLDSTDVDDSAPTSLEEAASQISSINTFSCLFCSHPSSSLSQAMSHMQKIHNFSIPHQDSLFDLGTFLSYLSTLITTFQECLYCGQTRDTVAAIRQHMVDKGHCSLAVDAAESSEFEDFYDIEEDNDEEECDDEGAASTINTALKKGDDELRLLSGRTLGHRSKARQYRKSHIISSKSTTQKNIEGSPSETEPASKTTDRRAAMNLMRSENANRGLIGLPELEKRVVRALEKKMAKLEVRARNQYQARVEKAANKQKFFKPDVPGPKNG